MRKLSHLRWNDIGSVENGIRQNGTEIGVNVLQFLHQLWNCFAMVGLEHGIRRMQLLNVRIVRIDVIGEWLLAGLLTMAHVAMFIVQTTLFTRETRRKEKNFVKWISKRISVLFKFILCRKGFEILFHSSKNSFNIPHSPQLSLKWSGCLSINMKLIFFYSLVRQ